MVVDVVIGCCGVVSNGGCLGCCVSFFVLFWFVVGAGGACGVTSVSLGWFSLSLLFLYIFLDSCLFFCVFGGYLGWALFSFLFLGFLCL